MADPVKREAVGAVVSAPDDAPMDASARMKKYWADRKAREAAEKAPEGLTIG